MRGRLRTSAAIVARRPLIVRTRRAAALFVAPFYHERISALHERLDQHDRRVYSLEQHMPSVLNAIASVNGTTRLLRRELDDVQSSAASGAELADASDRLSSAMDSHGARLDEHIARLDEHVARLDGHVRDELWPVVAEMEGVRADRQTLEWLVGRMESVRAELMYEMRYGPRSGPEAAVESRVIDEAKVEAVVTAGLKVNIGCGALPLDGYVNVDMRELPGVDVVAHVDDLPFEPGSLVELSSAHTLEHFPHERLVRQLLPYWFSLLAPDGVFRAIVPDLEAMMEQVRSGDISFDDFRLVAYGGQEYEGDFHHTGFSPESLGELLVGVGFVGVEVVERARPNGACLEFEITARRPS